MSEVYELLAKIEPEIDDTNIEQVAILFSILSLSFTLFVLSPLL